MRSAAPVRAWIELAGSGAFFSQWSWLATLPVAVTVLGGYDAATDLPERVLGVAFALLVHAVLGVLGIGCAAAERRCRSRPARVAVVSIGIGALGVLRPLLLSGLATWSGTTLYEGPLAARIATNVLGAAVLLTLVAHVVGTVRRQLAAAIRLHAAQVALSAQRARDERGVEELTRHALAGVRTSVDVYLSTELSASSDAPHTAGVVRRLSEELIRPLSHALHDERQLASTAVSSDAPPPAPHPEGGRLGPIALDPAPTWSTALAYAGLWLPFAASRYPVPGTLAVFVAVVLVSAVGNAVVARAWRQAQRFRTTALVLGYTGVGLAVTATAAVILSTGHVVALHLVHVVAYPVFASLLALGRAALRRVAEIEASAARSVDEARALALREHNRLLLARRRVARILHVEVQAACMSAALGLAHGGSAVDASAAVARIVALLDDAPPAAPSPSAQQSVQSVVAAWQYALDVSVVVDEGAWEALDADAARRELALDALSEALTNVARHATEPRAAVTLRLTETPGADAARQVTLEVRSPGAVRLDPSDGLGLAELRRRSLSVTLTTADDDARLQVTLP